MRSVVKMSIKSQVAVVNELGEVKEEIRIENTRESETDKKLIEINFFIDRINEQIKEIDK